MKTRLFCRFLEFYNSEDLYCFLGGELCSPASMKSKMKHLKMDVRYGLFKDIYGFIYCECKIENQICG